MISFKLIKNIFEFNNRFPNFIQNIEKILDWLNHFPDLTEFFESFLKNKYQTTHNETFPDTFVSFFSGNDQAFQTAFFVFRSVLILFFFFSLIFYTNILDLINSLILLFYNILNLIFKLFQIIVVFLTLISYLVVKGIDLFLIFFSFFYNMIPKFFDCLRIFLNNLYRFFETNSMKAINFFIKKHNKRSNEIKINSSHKLLVIDKFASKQLILMDRDKEMQNIHADQTNCLESKEINSFFSKQPIEERILFNNRLENNLLKDNTEYPIDITYEKKYSKKSISLSNKLILYEFLNDHGTARLTKYHINALAIKTKLTPLQCYDFLNREKSKIRKLIQ